MKAATVILRERRIQLAELAEPEFESDHQLRLRMLEVGVCGTDREIASFEYGSPPAGSDFLVIGHESLGEVMEAGRATDGWKPGDLAVLRVRRGCSHPECLACRHNRPDFCFTGGYTERGIRGRHGYMTEQVVDDARFAHHLPKSLREVGVLVEPLTIAEKSLAELRQIHRRMPWTRDWGLAESAGYHPRAVVLGAGPVGLLGAMALRLHGFEIWIYSRGRPPNDRSRIADEIGATYLSSEEVAPGALPERVGNIDVVFEATGASGFSFQVLPALGTNGVFVFTGVPGRRGPIAVDTDALMRNLVLRNQVVFGTVNAGPDAFEAAIQDLGEFHRRWPGALAALITDRRPLEDFVGLVKGESPGIKQVIQIA